MFLRWRIGEFHTRGERGPARRPRPQPVDLGGLREDLVAYEAYLGDAGRSDQAIATYIVHPRQFIDWLAGEFTPGARKRGAKTARPGPRSTTPAKRPGHRPRALALLPSDEEVIEERRIYAAMEPRDLEYRVARHLIEASRKPDAAFSAGDGVAVLLMSWNAAFYRFHPEAIKTLAADLDRLIATHGPELDAVVGRSIVSYDDATESTFVEQLYRDFVAVLWPVGTAKALHVLAPGFFPIWDTSIAAGFGLRLSPPESSAASYLELMAITREFAQRSKLPDPLKALDEWAYVRFTLGR